MEPADYDRWYDTPRGAWIGGQEYGLLRKMLSPLPGERLLDAGCGTGYFTRRFAAEADLRVVGLDLDHAWLRFAVTRGIRSVPWVCGSATSLPFRERAFDLSVSVTALCFVHDERQGLREMLRVTRRRIAIGLLHRPSLLYLDKGRGGGRGAYRGARWHSVSDIATLFSGLPVANLRVRTAIALPGGGHLAQAVEPLLSSRWPYGSFIAAAADVAGPVT